MLWPVLLPSGLLWLALYWSVLLWGYGSRGERVVMILLWVFVGMLPFLVSEHVRRLDFGISAPIQALENAADGRLTGSLFADLGILFELLPDSLTVRHLQADLHMQLRQWEQARGAYQEVLAMESGNAAALADLGTVYFHEGDLDNAVRYLQQAASVPDAPVQIYFNLSRALSEQYRFGESESMLRRASTLDSEAVGEWITAVAANQLVTVSAGLGQRKEIERELAGTWRSDEDASLTAMWRRMLSVPLALVLVGPAIGVFLLARRSRHRPTRDSAPWFENAVERVRVAVLPGLPEIERRRPGRAWLALAIALAFFTLPFSAGFGFPLPLGYSRAVPVLWAVAAGGIGLFVLIRFFVVGHSRKKKV
jgi:tetratricopeptide (TPR) repeat protein